MLNSKPNNILYLIFKPNKTQKINKFEIVYYALSLLYWIWVFIGVFSDYDNWSYIIIGINIIRFPISYFNRNFYFNYINLLPYLTILILFHFLNYYLPS